MDTSDRQDSIEDSLNESWVELHFKQQQSLEGSVHLERVSSGCQMEKLLLEAQKESRSASRSSSMAGSKPGSRGSPKQPQSPNSDPTEPISINVTSEQEERLGSVVKRQVETDWVWDWSSRPEAVQPSDYNGKFKHPSYRRSTQASSIAKKKQQGGGVLSSVSWLFFTHACTFCLGAAAMFIYLKKYIHWRPSPISLID